jgi:hypothetical protein
VNNLAHAQPSNFSFGSLYCALALRPFEIPDAAAASTRRFEMRLPESANIWAAEAASRSHFFSQ